MTVLSESGSTLKAEYGCHWLTVPMDHRGRPIGERLKEHLRVTIVLVVFLQLGLVRAAT